MKKFFLIVTILIISSICMATDSKDREGIQDSLESAHIKRIVSLEEELKGEEKQSHVLSNLERRFEILLKIRNLDNSERSLAEKGKAFLNDLEINEIVLRNNMEKVEACQIFDSPFVSQQLAGVASLLKSRIPSVSSEELSQFEGMIISFKQTPREKDIDLDKIKKEDERSETNLDSMSKVIGVGDILEDKEEKATQLVEIRQEGVLLKQNEDDKCLLKISKFDLSNNHLKTLPEFLIKIMPNLRDLNLSGNEIGDDGLRLLRGTHKLKKLNLSGTKISDDGLRLLSDIHKLKKLNLSGTKISDDGLRLLSDIHKLKKLNLSSNNIGVAARKNLKKALPQCNITF